MPSFTAQGGNLLANGPMTPVLISVSAPHAHYLQTQNQPVPQPVKLMGLIDTGATSSVIQTGVAQQLGLQPRGVTHISTASSQSHPCYIYDVGIHFQNNVSMPLIQVMEAPLTNPVQCLIGRDILSLGIFVYIGYVNTFSLSF